MEDESNIDDLNPVKKPYYPRELLHLLSSKSDDELAYEKMCLALDHGPSIIFQSTSQVQDICSRLYERTLHASSYNIDNFHSKQLKILESLLIVCPTKLPPLVCHMFYSSEVTMSLRSLILKSLSEAALYLSSRKPTSEEHPVKDNLSIDLSKYPSNTRVWSSALMGSSSPSSTSINHFVQYVRFFYYPLMHDIENRTLPFSLLDSPDDSVILGQLLDTIGLFVYCCGSTLEGQQISNSILQFIWLLKQYAIDHHYANHDILISKSNSFSQLRSTMAIRVSTLRVCLRIFYTNQTSYFLNSLPIPLSSLTEWWTNVYYHDSNPKVRELAQLCLSIVAK